MRQLILAMLIAFLPACRSSRHVESRESLAGSYRLTDTMLLRYGAETSLSAQRFDVLSIDSLTVTIRSPRGVTATLASPRVALGSKLSMQHTASDSSRVEHVAMAVDTFSSLSAAVSKSRVEYPRFPRLPVIVILAAVLVIVLYRRNNHC